MHSHDADSHSHSHSAVATTSAATGNINQRSHTTNEHSHAHSTADSNNMKTDLDESEAAHRRKVIATFDLYLTRSVAANSKRKTDFYNLSKPHRDLLPDYISLINSVSSHL